MAGCGATFRVERRATPGHFPLTVNLILGSNALCYNPRRRQTDEDAENEETENMLTPFNDARLTSPNPIDPNVPLNPTAASLSLTPGHSTPVQPTEIQTVLLNRLHRLVRIEAEWRHRVPDGDWRVKLIHKAIYSTYCDCIVEGVSIQARQIVRDCRGERLS